MKDYVTPDERKNLMISKLKVINNEEINYDTINYYKEHNLIKSNLEKINILVDQYENLYNLDRDLYLKITKLLFSKDQLIEKLFEIALLYQKQSITGELLFKKYSKLFIDSVQGRI